MSTALPGIPPNNPQRYLTLAQTGDDEALPHLGETFVLLEGEEEATFRGQTVTVHAGDAINIPSNATHRFLATRTTPAPSLDEDGQKTFAVKARALAPKYRTELLREA